MTTIKLESKGETEYKANSIKKVKEILFKGHVEISFRFLGPRGPLRVPSMTTRPQEKSKSPLQLNKSSQDHCQTI